jgi:hypothetical protein
MDQWIVSTKPNKSQARFIYQLFLRSIRIHGSELFTWHVENTLKAASKTATGYTLLKRLLSCAQQISFKLGKENKFKPEGVIVLAFPHSYTFQLVKTETAHRELRLVPNVALLIHELLHCWHFFSNRHAFYMRTETKSYVPHMDDQEEELTILGTLVNSQTSHSSWNHAIRSLFSCKNLHTPQHDSDDDPCCEITILRELNVDIRCSHQGITIRETSPSLREMIDYRAIPNIIQLFQRRQPILHSSSFDPLTTTLAYKTLAYSPKKIQDYHEIALILIKNGVQTELALKLAILTHDTQIVNELALRLNLISRATLRLAHDPTPPLLEIERMIQYGLASGISERKRLTISMVLFSKFFGKRRAPPYLLFQQRTVATKPPIAHKKPEINMISTGVSY